MKAVVFGAGAIGGVVACRLADAGHDVSLIARGSHAEAIRAHGLTLETPIGPSTFELPIAVDPADLDLRDAVVMLAVKSQDTPAALAALRRSTGSDTPVVCLQNGVENERLALRLFEAVYAVAVMCPTTHLEPGVVQANSTPITGLMDLGRYPAGVDDLAIELAASFSGATFESIARPDIQRWKYTKLLLNLGNAIEAVCGPEARLGRLGPMVKDEGVAVLRAGGIDFASDEEDVERRGDRLRLKPIDGARRLGGSSWQSLQRGTGAIETDYMNGEIVLLGRLHGVPTPLNALLTVLAHRMAAEGLPPGSFSESDVLDRLAD